MCNQKSRFERITYSTLDRSNVGLYKCRKVPCAFIKNEVVVLKNLQKAYRSIFHRIRVLFEGPRESILPRKFYIESNVFELEKKYIFNKLWLFIGLTNELCEPHSWMRKKIINKEILITFDGHDYHALENVCPHKNMRLRSEGAGKGLLYAATTLGLSKWMGALKNSGLKKATY